jgi:hypothetical protein
MIYIPVRAAVGQHIWDQARHCQSMAWSLRNLKLTRVVRAQAPADEFVRFCERLWQTTDPALRVVGLYKVLKPRLIAAQQAYAEATDPLGDMFSLHVVQQCSAQHTAHVAWADRVLAHLLDTPARRREAAEWQVTLEAELAAAGGVLDEGPEAVYLPYEGWPEDGESQAARAELPAATGQWRSTGYTYRKGFECGLIHLHWDERFHYAATADEMPPPPAEGTPEALVYWLHGLFHGECQTVDRMGWLLVDFPDLPWEMRFDLAQQAWEEARHISVVAQIIEGVGGQLGMYPFLPYFGHLRRDNHHPLQHLVLGNIIGESGAAAQTNEALRYTEGWANDWLRRGLEHLSADEVVHIGFGKKWGISLTADDVQRYWHDGKQQAEIALQTMHAAEEAWGGTPDRTAAHSRMEREFAALLTRKGSGKPALEQNPAD